MHPARAGVWTGPHGDLGVVRNLHGASPASSDVRVGGRSGQRHRFAGTMPADCSDFGMGQGLARRSISPACPGSGPALVRSHWGWSRAEIDDRYPSLDGRRSDHHSRPCGRCSRDPVLVLQLPQEAEGLWSVVAHQLLEEPGDDGSGWRMEHSQTAVHPTDAPVTDDLQLVGGE